MKHFDEFWALYPRKVAKGSARKYWLKAAKKEQPERIIAALRAQVAAGAFRDTVFIPYPGTWLNDERWDDELLPPAPTAAQMAARRGNPPEREFEARMLREALAEARRDGDKELEAKILAEAKKAGVTL